MYRLVSFQSYLPSYLVMILTVSSQLVYDIWNIVDKMCLFHIIYQCNSPGVAEQLQLRSYQDCQNLASHVLERNSGDNCRLPTIYYSQGDSLQVVICFLSFVYLETLKIVCIFAFSNTGSSYMYFFGHAHHTVCMFYWYTHQHFIAK